MLDSLSRKDWGAIGTLLATLVGIYLGSGFKWKFLPVFCVSAPRSMTLPDSQATLG